MLLVTVGAVVLVTLVVVTGVGVRLANRFRACASEAHTARSGIRDRAGLLRARCAGLRVALRQRRDRSERFMSGVGNTDDQSLSVEGGRRWGV